MHVVNVSVSVSVSVSEFVSVSVSMAKTISSCCPAIKLCVCSFVNCQCRKMKLKLISGSLAGRGTLPGRGEQQQEDGLETGPIHGSDISVHLNT